MLDGRTASACSINAGECPDCRAPFANFLHGPKGGMAENRCCPSCWSAFNVAFIEDHCFMAQRIPNDYWVSQTKH